VARGRSKSMTGLGRTLARLASDPFAKQPKRVARLRGRKRGGLTRSLGSLARFPQTWGGTKYGRTRRAKR